MCWNAEVSIQTYIFAIICLIIGYNYGFPIRKLIFMLVFSNIQLIEYFLWKNINNKKNNEFYSKLGYLNITLEPIAACLLIDNLKLRYSSLIISTLLFIIYTLIYYKKIDFSTSISKNGFLQWNSLKFYDHGFYYSIIWFLFFFGGIFLSKDIFIISISLLTFIYTLYNLSKHNGFASYWCSISNLLWLYVIGWIIYKNYKK